MKSILYAPWRGNYVTKQEKPQFDGCVFCGMIALHNDEEQFVVKRYQHCVLMLNRFPYTSGHLLVVPLKHVSCITELEASARAEMTEVTAQAISGLKQIMNPNAFTIGCNLGREAGASIPGHMHQHIIPRWGADLGFLELIGQTVKINVDLREFYNKLVAELSL